MKNLVSQLKKMTCLFVLTIVVFGCTGHAKEIDLSGTWKFKMDEQDTGIAEKWYSEVLPENIQLPGSMAINGKGNPVGDDSKWTGNSQRNSGKHWYDDLNYKPYLNEDEFLFPYWLIADKHYTGAAWYQKEVDVPEDWENKSIELFLERCHWETQVWVNENYVGLQNSLGTAHRHDLTKFLSPGKNKITICLDNRVKDIQVGDDAHSVTDNTQSNWNGIAGDIKLIQKDPLSISGVRIFSDIENNRARVEVSIENITGQKQKGKLKLAARSTSIDLPQKIKDFNVDFSLDDSTETIIVDYPMGDDVRLWDEFNPNLYELTVKLDAGAYNDLHQEKFGMRDFSVEGTRFTINGRPLFLRGTLECAIFPKTGFPPTDVEHWKRIINACRAHGLNHIRFHSWCPPEAAFEAADKLGFYFQVECSAWATIGDGKPIDEWVYQESEQIVAEYGNHPSFVMMAYGNEPHGDNHREYLTQFVSYWRNKDSRRVYTSGAGWPALENNQFHNLPQPRIQQWNEQLNSIINSEPPTTDFDWGNRIAQYHCPVVSHEIGQWCVYPNFKEVVKYDGVLKPKNFEIFKRSLDAHNMLQLADSFLLASGKLQALCYKADIEAALRTPGFAGFQLLDLHDFPGQGTALVGVLDPFWEEKGYISPEEYRRFCNETVPLARFKKRIFTSDEPIEIGIEASHFGEEELSSVVASWKIIDAAGNEVFKGEFAPVDLTWDNGIELGAINKTIPVESAKKFSLEVEVGGFANLWDFWVYPSRLPKIEEEILVVRSLNNIALSALDLGKKVLLSIEKGSIKEGKGGGVGVGFSSIFWNTAWTKGQKPHTLGILCDPDHSALAQFPTEYHSNWQWWDAMSHSNTIILENFSSPPDPIVRVIDDWVTNRNLALLFEAKVGNGKLLVSGIDLQSGLESRPEARQLLYSLKSYMAGEEFEPNTSLAEEEITDLFR
jgi:hypothetical protein